MDMTIKQLGARQFLMAFTLISLTGCKSLSKNGSSGLSGINGTGERDCPALLTNVGFAVRSELINVKTPLQFWDVSCNNLLPDNWLMLTPQAEFWQTPRAQLPQRDTCDSGENCDVELHTRRCESHADCTKGRCTKVAYATTALCTGHSDEQFAHVYDVVVKTRHRIEGITLGGPDDPYTAVFRRAFLAASERTASEAGSAQPLDFRFTGTGEPPIAEKLARDLAKGILDGPSAPSSQIRISGGVYGTSASWNHAKIVVSDGEEAIVGGHNWWASDYNRDIPLYDVSMRLRGGAALAAQRYIEMLWQDPRWTTAYSLPSQKGADARLPAFQDSQAGAVAGDVPVISVGTDGGLARGTHPGASDVALYAMMDAAKKTIAISQMELVSPAAQEKHTGLNYPQFLSEFVVDHLGKALMRGVKVYVVLSNMDKTDSISASYSHGWSLQKIADEFKSRVIKNLGKTTPGGTAAITQKLCDNLHLGYLRTSLEERPILNHAKVMIIDDQAFYVGSQNMYPGGMADRLAPQLAEFGWIVDSKTVTAQFLGKYWNPLWQFSKRTMISGSERPDGVYCTFM